MARPVRIEYPGAVYSVEAITAKRSFATNRTDLDILRSFLFAESCGETGCTDTFARPAKRSICSSGPGEQRLERGGHAFRHALHPGVVRMNHVGDP